MDALSVAEIRKRFMEKPVMGLRSPKSAAIQAEPLDSYDVSNSTNMDVVSSSPSQETHDTSASRDAKLVRVLPQGGNNLTHVKKPPVPLPASAGQNRQEDTYSVVSAIPADPVPNSVSSSGSRKPPVPLPTSANRDQMDDSLSISLDDMLPSRCTFFELDNMMDDYKRRNPRTIIYPKQKPPMPTVTTIEIDNLQRYSNA